MCIYGIYDLLCAYIKARGIRYIDPYEVLINKVNLGLTSLLRLPFFVHKVFTFSRGLKGKNYDPCIKFSANLLDELKLIII